MSSYRISDNQRVSSVLPTEYIFLDAISIYMYIRIIITHRVQYVQQLAPLARCQLGGIFQEYNEIHDQINNMHILLYTYQADNHPSLII